MSGISITNTCQMHRHWGKGMCPICKYVNEGPIPDANAKLKIAIDALEFVARHLGWVDYEAVVREALEDIQRDEPSRIDMKVSK